MAASQEGKLLGMCDVLVLYVDYPGDNRSLPCQNTVLYLIQVVSNLLVQFVVVDWANGGNMS